MRAELDRAEHLLDLGRVAQAEEIVRSVLAEHPDSSQALCLLVRVLLDQGVVEEGIRTAEAAVAADPAEEVTHRLLASALIAGGQFPKAVDAAQEATRLGPHLWQTHYLLGAALRANPGHRSSRQGLARALEAIRLAPSQPDPHVLAALCLRDLGKNRAADRENSEALRLDPQHASATQNLAEAQMFQGRLTDAGAALTAGLGNDPQRQSLHRLYDRVLARVIRRLAFAGFVLSAVLTALAIQEAPFPARLLTAMLGVALCVAGVVRVTSRLPRGSSRWTAGLVGRARIVDRLVMLVLLAVLAFVLFLGTAVKSAALDAAMAYRGFLATYGVVVIILGMRSVTSALANRI